MCTASRSLLVSATVVQHPGCILAQLSPLTTSAQAPAAFPKVPSSAVPFAEEQVPMWHLQMKEQEQRKQDQNSV